MGGAWDSGNVESPPALAAVGILLAGQWPLNQWTVPLEWNGGMEYWNDL